MLAFVSAAVEPSFVSQFLSQPIDVVLFQILLATGWIPIVSVLVWGFLEVYLDARQTAWQDSLKYVLLAIDAPRMTEQSPKAIENLFASLHGAYSGFTWKERWVQGRQQTRMSFEIVSIDGYIQFYIRCETKLRDIIEAGIYASYPEAQISEVEDYVNTVPSVYPHEEWNMWGSELVLKKPDYFPIRLWEDFEHQMTAELKDPLAIVLEQIGRMKPGECFWIQILIRPCDQKWQDGGKEFIKKIYGVKTEVKKSSLEQGLIALLDIPSHVLEQTIGVGLLGMLGAGPETAKPKDDDMWRAFKLTAQEKAEVEAVAQKVGKIGLQAKVRMLYFGRKPVYAKGMRTGMVKGMLQQYQGMNGFKLYGPQTPKDDYFWQAWSYGEKQSRITKAYKKRSFSVGSEPGILNAEELATLYHFPPINIKAPLVKKTEARRAEPPVGLPIGLDDVTSAKMPPPPMPEPSPFATVAEPLPHVPAPPLEISLPPMSMGTATSPEQLRPEAIPTTLPSPQAPVPDLEIRLRPPSRPAAPSAPARRSTPAVRPSRLPDAMRLMLEPGVELEDVRLPVVEPPKEEKTEETPPNLPV
ncbi:hypothetical protein HY734_01135 [Candidatus Uhrbacteria bacterium]|nr:hypothetical protein [Candidatus Uhrbacteria bacterium]